MTEINKTEGIVITLLTIIGCWSLYFNWTTAPVIVSIIGVSLVIYANMIDGRETHKYH